MPTRPRKTPIPEIDNRRRLPNGSLNAVFVEMPGTRRGLLPTPAPQENEEATAKEVNREWTPMDANESLLQKDESEPAINAHGLRQRRLGESQGIPGISWVKRGIRVFRE